MHLGENYRAQSPELDDWCGSQVSSCGCCPLTSHTDLTRAKAGSGALCVRERERESLGSVISDASPPKSLLQSRNFTSVRVENLNGTKEVLARPQKRSFISVVKNKSSPSPTRGNDSRKVNGAAAASALVHKFNPGRWFL